MSLAEYNYKVTTKRASETWDANEYWFLIDGSGGGTFGRDSSQASITYFCEYFYLDKFIDVVMGKTIKSGSSLKRSASAGNFDNANGSLPEEHPNLFNFFAATCELKPHGIVENDPDWGPQWKKAAVTVVFRPPAYNVIADGGVSTELNRFVTKLPEGQTDFLTTPGSFKFVTSGRVLDIQPGFTVGSLKFSYTWHQIPVALRSDGRPDLGRPPNITTLQPLVGTINSVAFDGYAPGTVLFVNWSAKLVLPQCATDNGYFWDITYILGVRDYGSSSTPKVSGEHIGWNYAYDPTSNAWGLYTTTGATGGNGMYGYADLTSLFSVGW